MLLSLLATAAAFLTLSGCAGSNSEPVTPPDAEQASSLLGIEAPSDSSDASTATAVGQGPEATTVSASSGTPTGEEAGVSDPASSVAVGLVDEQPIDEPSPVPGARPSDSYSDDFSSDTLTSWTLRHREAGEKPQYTLLDINRTRLGALTIEPTLTPGWFAGGTAPLIFKPMSGDFSVEVEVLAESMADPGEPPGANFNSAGLMARDPASGGGDENYVMVNLGRQNGGQAPVVGTETKTTRDSSSSANILSGTNRGRLILCRTGSDFRSFRMLDNETEWHLIGSAQRPDLPDLLQVGMVANGFSGPDLRATFFEIVLHVPQSNEDCTPP